MTGNQRSTIWWRFFCITAQRHVRLDSNGYRKERREAVRKENVYIALLPSTFLVEDQIYEYLPTCSAVGLTPIFVITFAGVVEIVHFPRNSEGLTFSRITANPRGVVDFVQAVGPKRQCHGFLRIVNEHHALGRPRESILALIDLRRTQSYMMQMG